MELKKIIADFLGGCHNPNRPLLLALSGGPDSLCLFHLLKEYPIAVAHVDHAWRPESAEEAKILQELAEKNSIPFHLKTLNPPASKSNLEAICREERLSFFKELCHKHDYQAVVLGHHQDDQAETVLKRVLEGHPLTSLQGINEVSEMGGVVYWRPLLKVPKKTILQWIQDQKLKPFHDKTNEDPRFLRAKMRTTIIPQLSEQFGKEVQEPLCRLARDCCALNDYLDQQIERYPILEERAGFYLLVPKDLHAVEKRHLIQTALKKAGLFPNHNQLDLVSELIEKADCCIEIGGRFVYLDRKQMFIPHIEMKSFTERFDLMVGDHQTGAWKISVTETENQQQTTNWQDVWKGKATVTLPKKDYQIGPSKNIPYHGSTILSKWWTNHKVPAFLRSIVPVIWEKEAVTHEFLTGKNKSLDNKPLTFIEVKLFWNP